MIELTLKNALDLIPPRPCDCNKGTFGTLLSFCGSSRYRGAALLSSLGALRCGAGILRLCCIESVAHTVSAAAYEATFLPVPGDDHISLSPCELDALLEGYPATACLCGCGIGVCEDTAVWVKKLICSCTVPLVLDADALNIVSQSPDVLKTAKAPVTVTPHIGEFARLSGMKIPEIKADPVKAAVDFSSEYGCVTVLKDYKTVIASPEGEYCVSSFGNPGLARGGSGDILAGMIASFNAQGLSPESSAECAVVLHGASADRCAERLSQTGMLPHDILDDLCVILAEKERKMK